MTNYLVVEIGYEYNDEGYDVHDTYEVKKGYTNKQEALDEADKLNGKTLRECDYLQDMDGDTIIPFKVIEVEVKE